MRKTYTQADLEAARAKTAAIRTEVAIECTYCGEETHATHDRIAPHYTIVDGVRVLCAASRCDATQAIANALREELLLIQTAADRLTRRSDKNAAQVAIRATLDALYSYERRAKAVAR